MRSETADVRRLLRHLSDPRELRKNSLVAHFFDQGKERAPRAQATIAAMARLRELVGRAVERLEPQPETPTRAAARDRRLYAIVSRCDVAGEKHEVVAADLGLSLRQFYRDRQAALARFSDAVCEELAAGPTGRPSVSSSDPRGNLPWQPTSFIGRTREVTELRSLIATHRLVTIIGSGGTGKTRAALETISHSGLAPRDGNWFVDLAAIGEGALVPSRVASILGVRLPEADDPLCALIAALENRELLLIVDNCEHVIGAARALAEAVLHGCAHVRLLATSRERLGIAGERVYQLATLPVPGTEVATVSEGRTYAAFELFAQRAEAVAYGIEFTDARFAVAADICRRLDGVALAIELAAARVPVLGLNELRRQLTEHFRVISGGPRNLPARQRTLEATIAWSYHLLDERERSVFRKLAIFASGWTLEAAMAVCADSTLSGEEAADSLFSLVEKSLASVDLDASTPRYSFFDSTHAFALEQLVASGEHDETARRHARWMAAFAERADDAAFAMPRKLWAGMVVPELDNALAALDWAHGTRGDDVIGAVIAGNLTGLWLIPGMPAHGRRYVNASLERIDAQEHPELVARLLLSQSQFQRGTAIEEAQELAVSLVHRSGNARLLARCLVYLAYTQLRMGKYGVAEQTGELAATLLSDEGLTRSPFYARFLTDRSILFRSRRRIEDATAALAQALQLATELEDDWTIAICRNLSAEIAFTSGDARRAVDLGEEALRVARTIGQESYFLLSNLACYHLELGDVGAVRAYAREAIDVSRFNLHEGAAVVQHLAAAAALQGSAAQAARLLGYANAYYERIGCLRDATDQKGLDILMEALCKQLSDEAIAAYAAAGGQLTREAAIAEGLRDGPIVSQDAWQPSDARSRRRTRA